VGETRFVLKPRQSYNGTDSITGKPEGRFSLTLVLGRCLRWELLTVCVPRLLLIGINFSQPFLLVRVVDLLGEPDTAEARNIGYGLIAATFLIFSARAILYVQYRQRFAQVLTLFRGACISLIYDQTLKIADGASSGGASVTLMSTDIQTCTDIFPMLNEIWASIIEVIVAIYLLSRQMGAFCVIPIIIYGLSTVVQGKIASGFATHVKNWNGMTQTRVSTTGTALTGMRSARISGIATSIKKLISDARDSEIKASIGYRYVVLLLNIVVAVGEHGTPLAVFVAYEISARIRGTPSLGTSQAFASLSIITLLQEPAAMVLIAFPLSASCLGALGRIQDFLLLPTVSPPLVEGPKAHLPAAAPSDDDGVEMLSVMPKTELRRNAIIMIDNITVRHSPTGPPALSDVSCSFNAGSLSMVIGPVGCGKTTFIKSILGEVSFETGSVSVKSSRFAFATQSAWLPNDSIQSLITGPKTHIAIDEAFYAKVIHACALNEDLVNLTDGDRTIIGSRGITLSGGQRQRIALARAIYAREDIVLLGMCATSLHFFGVLLTMVR
jgi:ATP-binding cassette subfamily C (CFTR/MRP) protein 1